MSRRGGWLFLAGLVLLSFNLRPAAVSVGPVLAEVRDGLSLSAPEASLLTTLPVLAFAVFGALAPGAAARGGLHRVTLVALVAVVVGLAGRAVTGSGLVFLALSLLAVAGMAMANVLMPSLVKRHAPERIGAVTAVYSTALAIGLTSALLLTVPLSEALGGWRGGLGAWAVLAGLALLPWLLLARHDRVAPTPGGPITVAQVARTRLGLAMAAFFGVQSLHAYVMFGWFAQLWRDAGYSPAAAGALVGLLAGVSIPLSWLLPPLLARSHHQRRVLLPVISCYPLAYVGLLVAPGAGAVLWAVLAGIGACTFPLILTLIGLRARTAEGTAALSAFTQSAGYLLAAAGPFVVGLLYDATGEWTIPLTLLLVLVVPMLGLATWLSGPRLLEDELEQHAARRSAPA
ncbi:MFS transporter [Nocardioides sp. OK12]|uniref:MFS transporter n=1 Tax=Nocardioides TaxID=1839 RepID=UPI0021C3A323|nr:MFS transporter [Nocardioides sp. OK12]GHJ57875.1 MFS transporter [Nocardioides sp. OK12]